MYKLKWWANTGQLYSKTFATLSEAINFSVYGNIPFQSMYGIDLIKE